MAPLSPRSPSHRGFMPLSNPLSNNYPESDMADIPLRNIQSHASSRSGQRKPNQQATFDSPHPSTPGEQEEKSGLFRHRSTPAGRRRAHKDMARQGTDGSDTVKVNVMGRLYNKIVGYSAITRYLVYIVPIAILLAIPLVIIPITGDTDRVTMGDLHNEDGTLKAKGPTLFHFFVWVEVAWLSLWTGKIVAHLLPPIFMFFCGVVSSGTRKYATVLRALEIPFSLFFWGLATWLVFKYMFTDDQFEWVHTLKRILLSLFISSAVFLVEKALVHLISISYHQRSFDNRIKESKHEIRLLGLLYDASRRLFPMYGPEFMEEDYIINDSIDVLLSKRRKGHKRDGSATPMRIVGDIGRVGDKITSMFGNLASEITGKQVFNPTAAHSIVVEALEKARSSEALARRIWMSFVVEGNDALYLDDIVEVLGPSHQVEAEEAFAAIDADGNGDISLDEMVRKVVEIGKERKAIANSIKDIGQALGVFDQILQVLVLLLVIFVFLTVFQSSFVTTLATAGTTLLSLSFVFAVTTQEVLGSCIFLFVKHPYDVGDRVDIQGPEKQQLQVEKISLLFTVFTRIDKMQVVQVPNIQLNNLWIENVTRSKAMKDIVNVNVSYDTSFEDLELLRHELENFVKQPENSRDFLPDITIIVNDVGDLDKLSLQITVKHKSNWHNEAVRTARRSKFMCALALALKRIPIYNPGGGGEALGGPTNPTYSVSVDDDWAAQARAKAEKEKEAGRLVPTKPAVADPEVDSHVAAKVEKQAADHLNERDPLAVAVDGWGFDNDTLTSRDPSVEARKRSQDIETIRSDLKREATRGRRKPGEALPPTPLGEDVPGLTVSKYKSNSNRTRSFDVEAGAGLSQSRDTQPSVYPTNSNPYFSPMSHPAAAPPTLQTVVEPPTPFADPLEQAGPSNTSSSSGASGSGHSGPTGARQRGASMSRPQAQGPPSGKPPGAF